MTSAIVTFPRDDTPSPLPADAELVRRALDAQEPAPWSWDDLLAALQRLADTPSLAAKELFLRILEHERELEVAPERGLPASTSPLGMARRIAAWVIVQRGTERERRRLVELAERSSDDLFADYVSRSLLP